jgi:hypothetical protein
MQKRSMQPIHSCMERLHLAHCLFAIASTGQRLKNIPLNRPIVRPIENQSKVISVFSARSAALRSIAKLSRRSISAG